MSIINALENYSINPFEYAHLIEDTDVNATSFKVYIPKLMALFPKKPAANINGLFNNNIFVNDSDCRPTTSQRVITQNFVTLMKYTERNFHHVSVDGIIPAGTRMIIHIMDENIRDMRIHDAI